MSEVCPKCGAAFSHGDEFEKHYACGTYTYATNDELDGENISMFCTENYLMQQVRKLEQQLAKAQADASFFKTQWDAELVAVRGLEERCRRLEAVAKQFSNKALFYEMAGRFYSSEKIDELKRVDDAAVAAAREG